MRKELVVAVLAAIAAVASGCIEGMDILPARITRPGDVDRDVAEEQERQSHDKAELDRLLAGVLVMSGDSNRPYEVLGQATGSGSWSTTGFRVYGVAFSSTMEVSAFDYVKIDALNKYGDRVNAVIGVVCQGLTCTGTAVHWK